jgi:dTMP kinase
MNNPGKFIVLEGGEGVGKSSNLVFVKECLEAAGLLVIMTREPGGTLLGERLRSILLDPQTEAIEPDAELLMMFAARAQHIAQKIKPALAAGHIVVSDRFTDASYAYQGGGRGLPLSRIAALEEWVQGDLRPDLVLLLDAPVAVGMSRAAERAAADRFEQEQTVFFERVRNAYLQRAKSDPGRYVVIDASASLDKVQARIKAALADFLRKTGMAK